MIKDQNNNEGWSLERLKRIFREPIILFSIYIITIPVWAAILLDLFEFPKTVDSILLVKLMPIVLLVGLGTSILWRKWWAIPCFLPVVYYFTGLGAFGGFEWIMLFAITVYAFVFMVIKGHLRSFLYLFLILYSGYFLDLRMAFMNAFTYAFLRFVYLAIDHNVYVFEKLGLKKSGYHLLKAFMYWSPLLLFILPINFLTNGVSKKVTQEIYRYTVVDSVEFHKDTSMIINTDRFNLSPNVTTVLFLNEGQQIVENSLNTVKIEQNLKDALQIDGAIDSANQWMIQTFIDTSLFLSTEDHFYAKFLKDRLSGKGSPIIETYFSENRLDFSIIDESDSIASLALSRVLSRTDTLRENPFEIGINEIEFKSNWRGDVNENNIVLTALQNANNKGSKEELLIQDSKINTLLGSWVNERQNLENDFCHRIEKPTIIVLKDISLDRQPEKQGSLYENINVAMVTTFKRFSNILIKRVREEVGEIDFSANPMEDLDQNVDNMYEELIVKLAEKEKDFINRINEHKISSLAVVTEEYNAIFPEPLLQVEKCKWYQIKKLITNEIKKNVNKRYSAQKRETKRKIDTKIENTYASIKAKVREQFDNVETGLNKTRTQIEMSVNSTQDFTKEFKVDFSQLGGLNEMIPNMIRKTSNTILDELLIANKTLFIALFIYSFLGTISLLYLILQTFLYVFARVTVSKKNDVYVSLNTTGDIQPTGSIRKCGDNYVIDGEEEATYYVSRKYEPSGCPPRFVIPFKKTSFLPRIKTKTYFMNKVVMNGNGSSVHFRTIGSQEFVEWNLTEGEVVTFNLEDLVAMSSTLKLKSIINFRVTTLILGKLFHKVVIGPGKLVLLTKGRPIISGEESADASLAQNRIMAFSKGTRFEIDSELNIADVYMSGFYLQKMPSDLIIIDADAQGKPSLGLIQYIKGLVSPF